MNKISKKDIEIFCAYILKHNLDSTLTRYRDWSQFGKPWPINYIVDNIKIIYDEGERIREMTSYLVEPGKVGVVLNKHPYSNMVVRWQCFNKQQVQDVVMQHNIDKFLEED